MQKSTNIESLLSAASASHVASEWWLLLLLYDDWNREMALIRK